MKQDIENLIDRLASKELTFGCKVITGRDYRLYKPENGPHHGIPPQGKISIDIGIIVSESDDRFYCVNDTHKAPWHTPDKDVDSMKILGHPVLIGDVLAHMWKDWKGTYNDTVLPLVDAWGKVGLSKSLQEIFDETEWEEVEALRATYASGHEEVIMVQVPKQKPHRELFEFLLTLNL